MAMSRAHQSESLSNNDSSLFTIEEIDTRIQQLLAENSELRSYFHTDFIRFILMINCLKSSDTLQQNNTYMRLLVSTLTEWHNEIDRIHASYHIKCDRAKQMIAEVKVVK